MSEVGLGEIVKIGQLDCNFMNMASFEWLAQSWLTTEGLHHVVTLNPEMIMLAERDENFARAAQMAQVRVPDGAGLTWARWYLRSQFWPLWPSLLAFLWQRVERVTGVDAIMELSRLAAARGGIIYLLGGEARDALATAGRIKKAAPGAKIEIALAHTYDPIGPAKIIQHIQQVRPAVLFVAYGAPKQTEWIENQRRNLAGVKIAVGVGGAFDILGERLTRAPQWLRAINMEWLWRLYLQPRRLPRIWQAVVRFPWLMKGYKEKTRS